MATQAPLPETQLASRRQGIQDDIKSVVGIAIANPTGWVCLEAAARRSYVIPSR